MDDFDLGARPLGAWGDVLHPRCDHVVRGNRPSLGREGQCFAPTPGAIVKRGANSRPQSRHNRLRSGILQLNETIKIGARLVDSPRIVSDQKGCVGQGTGCSLNRFGAQGLCSLRQIGLGQVHAYKDRRSEPHLLHHRRKVIAKASAEFGFQPIWVVKTHGIWQILVVRRLKGGLFFGQWGWSIPLA